MTADAIQAMTAAGVKVAHPALDAFSTRVRPRIWDELAGRLHDGPNLLNWIQRETGHQQVTERIGGENHRLWTQVSRTQP